VFQAEVCKITEFTSSTKQKIVPKDQRHLMQTCGKLNLYALFEICQTTIHIAISEMELSKSMSMI